MNRAAISIIGGLMGVLTGALVTRPLAAFFGSTPVTWDASSCPPGIYTITTLARGEDGVRTFSLTTTNVSLPKSTVVQQFPDLPPGTYRVSALSTANDGRAFSSSAQTVEGQGDGAIRFGRSRPPSNPPTGFARSRTAAPAPEPPKEPRSTAPVSPAARVVQAASPREQLMRRLRARLVALESPDGEVWWREIIFEDADGDGTIDSITIESVTGDVLMIRIDARR